ncbi:MAG: CPBP family intramembrane metalloprotease [Verrucomicrobiae bacterium]|nr:CPBP family intramembrane metalloprotease [Verrucomicrobiae bacterium]
MTETNPSSTARFWIALVPAMTVPFIASLLYFVVLSDHALGKVIYAGAKVFTVAWPVVCFVILWRVGLSRFKKKSHWGSLRSHLRALPLGVVTGLLIVGALWGLLQTPLADIVDASAPAIHKKATALGFLENYILFATFLSVLHSLIEEYFWRWFVFGHLRQKMSALSAAVLGSVAFASHHLIVVSQFFPFGFAVFLSICVAIGGLIWCWLYQRQGTLAGAWISHLIADAGLMTVGYFLLMR